MLYCRDNTADCAYTSKRVISHTFNTGYFPLNYSGNPGVDVSYRERIIQRTVLIYARDPWVTYESR